VRQAATKSHIVVEADIYFEEEGNTKECNINLQACISAVHKIRTMTLVVKILLYRTSTDVHKAFRCLPFCLHHLLFGFET